MSANTLFIVTSVDCSSDDVSIIKIMYENREAISFLCEYLQNRKKSNIGMVHELLGSEINEYIRYKGIFFSEKRMVSKYKIIEINEENEMDSDTSAIDVYEAYSARLQMPHLDTSELEGSNGKPEPSPSIPIKKAKITRNL